jgi:branched-chain amino acid transport system permease protein
MADTEFIDLSEQETDTGAGPKPAKSKRTSHKRAKSAKRGKKASPPASRGGEDPAAAESAAVQEAAAADDDFRPTPAGWAARIAVPASIVALIFALPAIVPFEFQADLVSLAAIFACVALSMNVLVGYLGQLSLGHQAFYGIGAFASALITTDPRFGFPFAVGIAAAALTGAVTALLIGYVALRVKGLYLAIVTLAYGLLAEVSIFRIGILSQGIPADKPAGFESPRVFAYLCLITLVLFFVFDWRLMKSKAGRAILAIRDDERVAASFGINVTSYKLLAFIISGTMAGIAGGLFGHLLGFVSAENEFDLFLGLTFVLMTVVGGLGNRVGVIIGAVIFATLDELLELLHEVLPFIPEPNPIYVPVIGALLLVLTLIQFPGGIGQQLQPIQGWVRGGRFDIHSIHDKGSSGGGMVGRP